MDNKIKLELLKKKKKKKEQLATKIGKCQKIYFEIRLKNF